MTFEKCNPCRFCEEESARGDGWPVRAGRLYCRLTREQLEIAACPADAREMRTFGSASPPQIEPRLTFGSLG